MSVQLKISSMKAVSPGCDWIFACGQCSGTSCWINEWMILAEDNGDYQLSFLEKFKDYFLFNFYNYT